MVDERPTTKAAPAEKSPRAEAKDRSVRAQLRDIFTRPVAGERGVAMMIVLTAIVILTAFTAEFTYNTRVGIYMAHNVERDVKAYFHARSAMNIAKLVIDAESMVKGQLGAFIPSAAKKNIEMWQFACKFAEIFNTKKLNFYGFDVVDFGEIDGIGVDEGSFSCEIIPEDGKVNLNAVGSASTKQTVFNELFALVRTSHKPGVLEEDDRKSMETILNIIDFIDADKNKSDVDQATGKFMDGTAGEDSALAKGSNKPKNAKLDTIEEIRLVEGVDDDFYCKIADKVTVYNTEKLNVNTADIEVVKALLCDFLITNHDLMCGMGGMGMMAPIDIVGHYIEVCRQVKKAFFTPAFTSSAKFLSFFKKLPEPLNVDFKLNETTLKPLIGTSSRVLRIVTVGQVGKTIKHIEAVVDTSTSKFIYWHEY